MLIYGKFGLPEMGGVGCGLAQAIVMWLQLILILIVVCQRRFNITAWRHRFSWPDWHIIKTLLAIGIPIGTTIFAEVGLFSLTTLLLGKLGASVVASHNVAINLNAVFFMPPMALGMAATIRIGFRIGSGEITEGRMTAAIAAGTTAMVAIVGAILIFLLRYQLVGIYTTDPAVLALSANLLLFVVFFLFFDATQATCVGALRGYKDTRIPMYIALFSYWGVGLPLEVILGFGLVGEPMGVYGFWTGLAMGVGVAALLLAYRLWRVSGNEALIRKLSNQAERQAVILE